MIGRMRLLNDMSASRFSPLISPLTFNIRKVCDLLHITLREHIENHMNQFFSSHPLRRIRSIRLFRIPLIQVRLHHPIVCVIRLVLRQNANQTLVRHQLPIVLQVRHNIPNWLVRIWCNGNDRGLQQYD